MLLLITQRVLAHDEDGDCGDDYNDHHPGHVALQLTAEQAKSLQPFTKDFAIPSMLAVKSIAQQPSLWAKTRDAQLARVLVLETTNAILRILNRLDRSYTVASNRYVSLASVEYRATAVAFLASFVLAQQKYVVAETPTMKANLVYATTAKATVEAMKSTVTVVTEIRANYRRTETLTVAQAKSIQAVVKQNEPPLQAVTTIAATAQVWQKTESVQVVAQKMAAATVKQNQDVYVAATTAAATATYKVADMTYKVVAEYEMARVAETTYVAVTTAQYQATYRQSYQYVAANAVVAKQIATGQIPPQHDLTVTGKGPTDLFVGDDANYEVTVTNNGPGDVDNLAVTVTLPSEAVTNEPGCQAGPSGIVCLIQKGRLGAGETVTIAIPSYYPLPGSYRVTASVPTDNDLNAQDNRFDFAVTQVEAATTGLSASFAGSPVEANVGQPVTLTFTFMNSGRADAIDAQLRLDLASTDGATWTVDAATTSQGTYQVDPTGVTYEPGTVKANTTISMTVTYTPQSAGVVAATLSSTSVNYVATTTTYVTTIKETATVTVNTDANNPVEIASGTAAQVTYAVDTAVATAATVNVTATSPDQTVTATVVTVEQDGQALRCTPLQDGSLECPVQLTAAKTASITATVEADLNDPLAAQGQLRVTANVKTAAGAAGTATASITVVRAANTVAFSSTEYTARENDRLVAVTVVRSDASVTAAVALRTVDGTAAADRDYKAVNTVLNFAVGEKSKNVDIEVIDNTLVDGDRDFFVELSEPRGNVPFARARVNIVDDEVGCVPLPESDDIACSDGKDNDCDGSVDCADSDCLGTRFCVSDLSVQVSPSQQAGTTGTPLAYGIHVINAGPLDATVTVTVPLQRSATLISITSTEGDVCRQDVGFAECTFNMKAASGSDITVVKSYQAAGVYPDKVTVATPFDPDLSGNEATYTAIIDGCIDPQFCFSDLSVQVSPSQQAGTVGVPLAYGIHVINAGPLDATVTVTVPLQRGATLNSITSTEGDVCRQDVGFAECVFRMKASTGSDITVVKTYQAPGDYPDKVTVATPSDPDLSGNEATYTAVIQ
ncbi:MAG: Calx-beta domain-containing protein [bacterium]